MRKIDKCETIPSVAFRLPTELTISGLDHSRG